MSELFKHLERVEHLFVLNGDHVRWVVTRADLNAPAVGVVALAYLTVIEGGFRELARSMPADRLFAFFSGTHREDIERLYLRKKRDNTETGVHDCLTLGNWFHVVRNHPPFLELLGFADVDKHRTATDGFQGLRNSVAHGGRLLDEMDAVSALKNLRQARNYATRVWDAVDKSQPVWSHYADSIVAFRKNGKETVLAGPDAAAWDDAPKLHVITAWNPGSIGTDGESNRKANEQLKRRLKEEGVESIRSGVGRARDHSVEEDSYIVRGLTTQRAAALGDLFGQAAVFEIDKDWLRVLRCPDAAEMGRRDRRV